jgi:transcriptional regulator with XRE-family HTH domain
MYRYDDGPEKVTTEFSEQFRKAREQLGWSLRDAERVSGVSNAHINQIENGRIIKPGFTVVTKLAKAYGIPELKRCPTCGEQTDAERERIIALAESEAARIGAGTFSDSEEIVAAALLDFATMLRREKAR